MLRKVPQYDVLCDGPESEFCHGEYSGNWSQWGTLAEARARGWKNRAAGLHLCPYCVGLSPLPHRLGWSLLRKLLPAFLAALLMPILVYYAELGWVSLPIALAVAYLCGELIAALREFLFERE